MEVFNTILTVIYGLLMLTLLVVIHEGGHFFVGKSCDIRIDEFSVGFGPKLLHKEKNGISSDSGIFSAAIKYCIENNIDLKNEK